MKKIFILVLSILFLSVGVAVADIDWTFTGPDTSVTPIDGGTRTTTTWSATGIGTYNYSPDPINKGEDPPPTTTTPVDIHESDSIPNNPPPTTINTSSSWNNSSTFGPVVGGSGPVGGSSSFSFSNGGILWDGSFRVPPTDTPLP